MTEPITEESILELLRDDSKFAAKIEQLTKARKGFEQARSDANITMAALTRQKIETDNYVNGKKAELAAKQKQHDDAAREAAARIEVGRSQAAEVLKVREQNMALSQALAARESALSQREQALKNQQSGIAAQLAQIARDHDLVSRQIAHINAVPKQ